MKDQQEGKVVGSGKVAVGNAEVHCHVDARELGRRAQGPYETIVCCVGVDSRTARSGEEPSSSPVSEGALPAAIGIGGKGGWEDICVGGITSDPRGKGESGQEYKGDEDEAAKPSRQR